MTNIISAWADTQKTEEVLNRNSELKKLVHDFLARFKGFYIGESITHNGVVASDKINLYDEGGLLAGALIVERRPIDGKSTPVYMFNARSVTKSRSSKFADANTRDSIKITGLLKTIEKNNDLPTKETLYKEFYGGIGYAFAQVGRGEKSIPRLDPTTVIEVLKRFTGEDTTPLPDNMTKQVDEVLIQYERKLKADAASTSDLVRYGSGCTAIAWGRNPFGNSHYLVGSVRYDGVPTISGFDSSKLILSDLRRYSTLADTPHAGLVTMLREYFKGTERHNPDNEMGFDFHDKHHPDMDVACGYSGSQYCWILIPNAAPTV